MELESDIYDVVVIGTGLAQSIVAAALAKSGKSVLHLDPNDYYGDQQASLTLDELQSWCQSNSNALPSSKEGSYEHGVASSSKLDESLTKNRRRYALSLFPAILPSRGPLIQTLISSGVSKYVSFRMLDSVSVWQDNGIRRVPGSKEQVFKDKEISLMEKRRLMKFLMFSAGELEDDPLLKGKEKDPFPEFLEEAFSLPTNLASQVAYAIAHCSSPTDPTLEALKRTRRYIKSIGRYGSGAFLVGQYGGAGEIAQGFCRACAVFGGTYVLGKESIPESIAINDDSVTIKIPCHPRPITAKHLVTSPNHLPPDTRQVVSSSEGNVTAHCIALLPSLPESLRRPKTEPVDGEEEGEDDTAVIVFPPTENQGLVRALVMGEGTGSCPAGQFVLYLSTTSDSDPQEALKPFLSRLSPETMFESYYSSRRSPVQSVAKSPIVMLDPYGGLEVLTEGLDWEAEQGEKAFWAVMGSREVEDGQGFFDKVEDEMVEEEHEL